MCLTKTKIALLKCGELKGKAYEQNGSYYDIFSRWVPDDKFTLDSYDVVQDIYPDEDLYDSIMLTGSGTCIFTRSYIILFIHLLQPLTHTQMFSG